MTSRRSFLIRSAGAIAASSIPRWGFAQDYPSRPIKVIVTFPAGGPSDTAVRIVQPSMQKALGQPVIVENIGGAAGILGLNRAKQSDPDGYTLVQVASPHTTAAATKPGSVDLLRDFEPVGVTGIATFTLVVSPGLGVKTLKDFLALARLKPGTLKFASLGVGSAQHLVMEMLIGATKIEMTHIPYRGEAPAVPDIATGRVDVMFLAGAKQYIEGGQVIGIGVTSAEPWFNLPGLVPLSKQGLANFVVDGWSGIAAPKGTPAPIIAKLSQALSAALKTDESVKSFNVIGFRPGSGTPEPMTRQIEADMRIFTNVIRERNLKFE